MKKLFSMHSKEGLPNGANEIESTTTGFIVSSEGQHKYPGKKTMIPNANGRITMSKVGYPVLGIDDLGNSVMMQPGGEYQFPGNDVYEIPMAQDGLFLRAGKFRPQTSTIGSTLGFKKVFPKKETTWTLTGDVGYGKNYNTDKEGLAASINAENFGKFFGGQRRFNAITNLEAFVEPGNYGGQFFAGPNFHWGTHPKRNLPRGTGRVDFQPFNMRVGYQSTPWEDDSGDALFQGTGGRMNYGLGTRLKGEYALPKRRALRGSKMNPVLFGDVGVDFDFLKSDYDEEGVARGSIHGTPTGFTINPSFSANVGIRVPIDGSRLRRRPKPSLVEDDVYYNPGIRVSDPEAVEAYEEPDDFQDGGTPKVKQRRGARKNPDGTVSTHLMMVEYIPERGWVAFPSLFQNSIPYADDSQNWVDMSDEEDWMKIYKEADARGEVYDFGEDKEAALAFGKGSWKNQLPDEGIEIELTDEEVEQYAAGGYVLEELQYGGEDDIIRPKGDPYEYKKVGDKYYTRRREGEYEREYAEGEEPSWNLATGQVRDDIRYKVFKEQRPTDSSKDNGEVHWRNKTGEPYKKDFHTAYLDGDIDQDKYSFIKWASNDIDNAINQTTDVSAKIALLRDKKRLDLQYDEIVNQGGVWQNDGTFSWPAIEKQKKELEQLEKPTWLDPIFDATNALSVGSNNNVGQKVSDVTEDVTGNKTAGKIIGTVSQEAADTVPWYLLSRLAGPVAIVAGVATSLDSAIESENPNYKRQIVDDVKEISRRTSQSYYPDWNNNQFTLDSRMRRDLNEVFGAGDAIQSAGRSIQKGWNNMANTVSGWFNEDGGIVVDLNEDEALAYAQDGYIVEEMQEGGEFIENVISLLDKDGVHPLDLVYGNEELGIPKMGTLAGLKSIPELADYFFDPNGDMMNTYIELRGNPEEASAATKKKKENYLSNIGKTKVEDAVDEAYRLAELETQAEQDIQQKENDPMSNIAKANRQKEYQRRRNYDDSGQFVEDVGQGLKDLYAGTASAVVDPVELALSLPNPNFSNYDESQFQREDFRGNFLSPFAIGRPLLVGKNTEEDKTYKNFRGGLSDLYRYYGGLPLQNNILEYSTTAPPDAKDKSAKYISLNKDKVFLDEVWNNYLRVKSGKLSTTSQGDKEKKIKDGVWHVSGYSSGGKDHHKTKKQGNAHHSNAIGRYKLSEGKDDKGHFIQYYDVFDQGTAGGSLTAQFADFLDSQLNLRKPFEIYDRIYYDPETMERTYLEEIK